MEIGLVVLQGNMTALERGPVLKELKTGGLIAKKTLSGKNGPISL
jgi:hypothetical protein